MKHRLLALLLLLTLVFSVTGCGEDPELTRFKNEIDSFCNELAAIDSGMNNINTDQETAKEDLLNYLDRADDAFRKLAKLTVPAEFAYIEELADKASEDMTEAVSLYHEAFGNNSFNEYTFDYACEYYKRSYKRLNYIITFLHQDVPEGDDLIIYDENTLSTSSSAE